MSLPDIFYSNGRSPRELRRPCRTEPPKRYPLPWRIESGYGWGPDGEAVVSAKHDSGKGVDGSSVIVTHRGIYDSELREYLATAGNFFPRALALLRHIAERERSSTSQEIEELLREIDF